MAVDLSKVESRGGRRMQPSRNRDSFIRRRETRTPGLEVNAPLTRPRDDGAAELKKLLGLTNSLAGNIAEMDAVRDAERDKELRAQGGLAFSSGEVDEEQLAKQEAYYEGFIWSKAGARAAELDAEATLAANEYLATEDASPEGLDEVLNEVYSKHLIDPETGEPLDFGTPEATALMAQQAAKTRARLRAEAMPIIADQVKDEKLALIGHKYLRKALPQSSHLVEFSASGEDGISEVDLPPSDVAPPTGRPPLGGAVTTTFEGHKARGSVGVDIDGKIGDPIEAPAGGTVRVGRNGPSGLFVEIDHGNGVVSTYSHLSNTDFQTGDVIRAGETLGLVGNSGRVKAGPNGDGSHLHWRVKVNGEDVDPLAYRFEEVNLASAPDSPQAMPRVYPQLCFECAIEEAVADGIPRGRAKDALLTVFLTAAEQRGDPVMLRELAMSVQKDGKTPSFNPDEIAKIFDTRTQLIDRNRVARERAERKAQEEVEFQILLGEETNPWSDRQILDAMRKRQIDPRFGHSLLDSRRSEREAALSRAEAERDMEIEMLVSVEAEALRMGLIEETTAAEITENFHAGAYGPPSSKKAIARYRRMMSSYRAGGGVALDNPEAAKRYTELKALGGSGSRSSSRVGSVLGGSSGLDDAQLAALLAAFTTYIKAGDSTDMATLKALADYGPKASQERAQRHLGAIENKRIKELEAKEASGP